MSRSLDSGWRNSIFTLDLRSFESNWEKVRFAIDAAKLCVSLTMAYSKLREQNAQQAGTRVLRDVAV